MPLHDGTGPWGLGPGSGRRRGRCYTNVFQSGFDRKHGWLFGVLLPLGTAIVRDLLNPSGVIRRIVHVSSVPKIDNNAQKIRRNAEFTVVNTDMGYKSGAGKDIVS